VEGPSDRDGLRALFESLMDQALHNGCLIKVIPMEGKQPLMTKVPLRGVNILRNERDAHVFALPDLYPPNIGYPHSSCDELKQVLVQTFQTECSRLGVDPGPLMKRFHVHCLKHDLEALLLALEERLKSYLKLQNFPPQVRWTKPVKKPESSTTAEAHHRGIVSALGASLY
jgi:hypothetical protein